MSKDIKDYGKAFDDLANEMKDLADSGDVDSEKNGSAIAEGQKNEVKSDNDPITKDIEELDALFAETNNLESKSQNSASKTHPSIKPTSQINENSAPSTDQPAAAKNEEGATESTNIQTDNQKRTLKQFSQAKLTKIQDKFNQKKNAIREEKLARMNETDITYELDTLLEDLAYEEKHKVDSSKGGSEKNSSGISESQKNEVISNNDEMEALRELDAVSAHLRSKPQTSAAKTQPSVKPPLQITGNPAAQSANQAPGGKNEEEAANSKGGASESANKQVDSEKQKTKQTFKNKLNKIKRTLQTFKSLVRGNNDGQFVKLDRFNKKGPSKG